MGCGTSVPHNDSTTTSAPLIKPTEPEDEEVVDPLAPDLQPIVETSPPTPEQAATPIPIREGTLDVLLNGTRPSFELPLEPLEDLIVDDSYDVQETLAAVTALVHEYSADIIKLYDDCRSGEACITKEVWVQWGSSLDADIDVDTAENQYHSVCGYPLDEGGEASPKEMDLGLFACCLVRIANLYTIQNKGNPMDSDLPSQLQTFWGDRARAKVSSLSV